jgi:P-type Ca2+ transporter type 2C
MRRPPRRPDEALLSRSFLILIGWQGAMLAALSLMAYIWALSVYGKGEHARTVALLTLVSVQLGHLFNCRSQIDSAFAGLFRNVYIWIACVIVAGLQLLAIYFVPLARVLGTARPTVTDWMITGLSFIAPIIVVELTKAFARREKTKM